MRGMPNPAIIGARKLRDLAGVGAATEANLRDLGFRTVEQLAEEDPSDLYVRLGAIEGRRPDPCVLDVFRCIVEQARDPQLAPERRDWWWWSRQRKSGQLKDVDEVIRKNQ